MSLLRIATRSGCRTDRRVGTVNVDQRKLFDFPRGYIYLILKLNLNLNLFAPIKGAN